jgi:hypothetical protein
MRVLYISQDNGYTWSKSESFGLKSVGDISLFKQCIYAGKSESNGYVVSKSCDLRVPHGLILQSSLPITVQE